MLTFRQFFVQRKSLMEDTNPFGNFPGMKVMSLDQFVATANRLNPGMQTEEEEGEPFGLGAKTKVPTGEQLRQYLNRIFTGEKTKADKFLMPYIHNKLVKTIAGKSYLLYPGSDVVLDTQTGQTFNIEELKRLFKIRPQTILSQNTKMKKSGGEDAVFYNFGIPALVGMAVNEQANELVVVSTCPGAGECMLECYALKGGYLQYPESSMKQTRMLNFLLNDPKKFFAMLKTELTDKENKAEKNNVKIVVRWHDAGDFFSEQYKNLFFDVVKEFPNVLFYAYTKVASVALSAMPDNLVMNYSQGAKPTERQQIDFKTQKHSVIVPKQMFMDLMVRRERADDETGKTVKSLVFKTPLDLETFKNRLTAKYGIEKNSILTYAEMLKTPFGQRNQYNVFVVPGEGDVSASRRDVHGTYLLVH